MTNLKTIDAETLLSQPMRQPLFLVDSLLAPGLYILAGASKVGKSWLALWLCTRIVSGKLVWKFAVRSATGQPSDGGGLMATFTAIKNNKQTADVLGGVLKYIQQEKKTRAGGL